MRMTYKIETCAFRNRYC